MNNSMELSFKINNEEMEKFKKILTSGGVRHYLIKITNGEELDVVEYKEYQKLEQENRKLKQQLSNSHQIKTQQKEFIEYMNKVIKELELLEIGPRINNVDEELNGYLIQRANTFKEILSKYKSIIGASDE